MIADSHSQGDRVFILKRNLHTYNLFQEIGQPKTKSGKQNRPPWIVPGEGEGGVHHVVVGQEVQPVELGRDLRGLF